jgi:hypothetical protein
MCVCVCGGGGGYLLQHVGVPFVVTSKKRCCFAFEALAALHAVGIIHGDLRVPNLLVVGKRLVWIDLRIASLHASGGPASSGPLERLDAATLARSVLKLERLPLENLPICVCDAVEVRRSH